MSTKSFVAAAALLAAATGVWAQEATYELPQPISSQTTRAAVLADLQQARMHGTLQLNDYERQLPAAFVSTRSRADVRAEAMAAAASGQLQALNGENNSFDGNVMTGMKHDASRHVAAIR